MSRASDAARSSFFTPLWVSSAVGAVVALAVGIWVTRGRDAEMSHFIPALFVMAFDAIPVSGWLIAAWGYGALVRQGLGFSEAAYGGTTGDSRSEDAHVGPPGRAQSGGPDLLGALDLGLGVPTLLWLDHALGAAGVLQIGGSAGGWLLLCVGWLAALLSVRQRVAARSLSLKIGGGSSFALVGAVPAAVVLLIAATSAPGWLWGSEAKGYDVLEYHLQMPREWLTLGMIRPLTHNAYSFAPSYVEAAYYHLAVLLDPLATRPSNGAVAAATACQLLHAALMIWAAREVTLLARRYVSHWMALAAGAIAISVPWVVVTGSMAYNEAPLIGLLALCWRLVDAQPRAWRSFVLIGFLAGVACGAKLTAIGGVVAPVGVLLLLHIAPRQWPRMIGGCVVGGLIALGPYLIRNYVALDGGNPLFPFATGLLGTAHWTAEQAARWHNAHSPHEPWLARLASLWEMGFVYSQWAGLWFVAVAAGVIGWMGATKKIGLRDACVVLVLQLGFWLLLTHMQSRFLLPCLPALVVVIVMGLDVVMKRWRAVGYGASVLLPVVLGGWSIGLFEDQGGGNPTAFVDGVVFRTGVTAEPLPRETERQLVAANSTVYLNLRTRPEQGLYLLGDATPFYILRPVLWHTTWDTSPLGEAMRAHPGDENAWAQALIDRGISLVLVNYSELDRLVNTDHWYDPIFQGVDIKAFFDAHARPIAAWPGGRVLYQLVDPGE